MRALVIFLGILFFPGALLAAELTVTVTGIRSARGVVRIAVFDNPDDFPQGAEIASANVAARIGSVVVRLTDLAPGRYAVAMHHDENGNGEMDTVFFVIPREGYGFSNDARVIFAPPVFAAAAFTLAPGGGAISLEARY